MMFYWKRFLNYRINLFKIISRTKIEYYKKQIEGNTNHKQVDITEVKFIDATKTEIKREITDVFDHFSQM